MNEEQASQFERYGCVSRCIIRLSEKLGKPISRDQFIARYADLFPGDKEGLLSIDELCFVTKDLELCQHLDGSVFLPDVVDSLENRMPVFLFTSFELDLSLKIKGVSRHVRLVEGIHSDEHHGFPTLKVWNPLQDGTDMVQSIVLYRLEREGAFYLIPQV